MDGEIGGGVFQRLNTVRTNGAAYSASPARISDSLEPPADESDRSRPVDLSRAKDLKDILDR